ncbi:sorting and assembly machinery component 50 [Anaeramoeba ignava]|uniref:Sorting and assembly machinery component 50 n=1 Tax=Anaeramoeba ignava TaxID=1746090 RepID=A0A9Q0L742_ANAIG|nr:sorting and assembly machinery component 50 [Anaeramoeba ignava]
MGNQTTSSNFKISGVNVTGLKKTKRSVIESQIEPVLQQKTYTEALKTTNQALQELQKLGIFDEIKIEFDSKNIKTCPEPKKPVLNVSVREGASEQAKIKLISVNGDVGLGGLVAAKNIFGKAENAGIIIGFGMESRLIQANYSKPFLNKFGHKNSSVHFLAYHNKIPYSLSSFQQKVTGAKFEICNDIFNPAITELIHERGLGSKKPLHFFSISSDFSDVIVDEKASWKVRKQAKHSFKLSLSHESVLDKRDSLTFPTQGIFLKSQNEVAGLLGGNVHFLKSKFQGQLHFPIIKNLLNFHLLSHFGVIIPTKVDEKIGINDKLFFGGFTPFRGIHEHSLGKKIKKPEREENEDDTMAGYDLFKDYPKFIRDFLNPNHHKFDILGGDLYGLLTGMVSLKFPFNFPCNLQFFASSGNLVSHSNLDSNYLETIQRAFDKRKTIVGVGLAFGIGSNRIEVNYTTPIKITEQDPTYPISFSMDLHLF